MDDYILEYIPENYYKKERVRKVMLSLAVISDIVMLIMIGTAIIVPIWWIGVVSLIIFNNSVRVCVNILPKKYRYGIKNGKFEVSEITPSKSRIIISSEIDDIIIENIDGSLEDIENDILKLTDNSCQLKPYMVKFNEKRIVIGLDEYLYFIIDGMKSKIETN